MALNVWQNPSLRDAALSVLQTISNTAQDVRPEKPRRDTALKLLRTVKSATQLVRRGKSQKTPAERVPSDAREHLFDILLENALIEAVRQKHDTNESVQHKTTLEVLESFHKGERQDEFKTIKEKIKAAYDQTTKLPDIDDIDVIDRAKIDSRTFVNTMVSREFLPVMELRFISDKYPIGKKLYTAISGDDFSSQLGDAFEDKEVRSDSQKSRRQVDMRMGHETSGQRFRGRICGLKHDLENDLSVILVEQIAPKTSPPAYHQLRASNVKFVVMDHNQQTNKELKRGQIFDFKLPKLLDRMDEASLEKYCEVVTAQDYANGTTNAAKISGTIAKEVTESLENATQTIWVELLAAQKAIVKLVKLTAKEHGLFRIKVGHELNDHPINLAAESIGRKPSSEHESQEHGAHESRGRGTRSLAFLVVSHGDFVGAVFRPRTDVRQTVPDEQMFIRITNHPRFAG